VLTGKVKANLPLPGELRLISSGEMRKRQNLASDLQARGMRRKCVRARLGSAEPASSARCRNVATVPGFDPLVSLSPQIMSLEVCPVGLSRPSGHGWFATGPCHLAGGARRSHRIRRR
jgi:hypothetical protein